MSINKNINVNPANCRLCDHLGVVTISPTLFTDREVTYNIHGHGMIGNTGSADNSKEIDEKIDKAVQDAISSANAYTNERVEVLLDNTERLYERVKYEIVSKPEGTIVEYRDDEIRVMCPADTVWTKQNVGETGDSNKYYMGFRAYAPEDAVSFKEGLGGGIVDEMFTFDDDFAGTDELGRNYSICWLPLASYDEATDTWTYYGENSSTDKYLGWTYAVEWYNADGMIIDSDRVRINLSNEECHHSVEPSYITEAVNEANTYTDEQILKIKESVEDATAEDIENLFK